MKSLIRSFFAVTAAVLLLVSCDKADELPNYGNGKVPVLSSSSSSLAATAADSLSDLVTFSWTYPAYATDSTNHKYILQIDSAGKDFSNAASRTVMAALSTKFTAKEMNDLLLSLGFDFDVTYGIQARVISSYGNNNDRLVSQPISLTAKPYKIPPAVALPFTNRLYIVGGSTQFGWDNTAPFPAVRELTRLDETTWAGIYNITGSGGYLLLPEAGSWNNKYSIADNSIPGIANAGNFGYNLPQNFASNMADGDGWHRMVYDFQRGKYTITKENNALKNELFITGDATPSSWTNSPPGTQQLTQLTNGVFEITMPLVPGKLFKFLDTNGQWQPQFGGSSATGGDLEANYGSAGDPPAIPTPSVAGTYKITVNFITKKYTVTPL
jgi:hypothetical protein